MRVRRSLIDHPRLDPLSARAVRAAGTPMSAVPDALLGELLDAWESGNLAPLAFATAQWAWMRGRPVGSSDAMACYLACLCERAVRIGGDGLSRVGDDRAELGMPTVGSGDPSVA